MAKNTSVEDYLSTKDRVNNTVTHLQTLLVSEGWIFLRLYLSQNLADLQEAVNSTDINRTTKEDYRLKVKREYLEQLLELPERFIKQLQEGDVGEVELDAYE